MKLSIHFLVIVACAIIFGPRNANGLFEDQIGKFDWYVSTGKYVERVNIYRIFD